MNVVEDCSLTTLAFASSTKSLNYVYGTLETVSLPYTSSTENCGITATCFLGDQSTPCPTPQTSLIKQTSPLQIDLLLQIDDDSTFAVGQNTFTIKLTVDADNTIEASIDVLVDFQATPLTDLAFAFTHKDRRRP